MTDRLQKWTLGVLFALCTSATVSLTSCGALARGDVLPTIAQSYRNVVEPVLIVGIGAEQDAGGITAQRADELRALVGTVGRALEGQGDVGAARTAWELLQPFAEAGIDRRVARGEIGPGVGASLKEVLRLFAERLIQYVEGSDEQNAAVVLR